jgi:hypothetical protein
MEKPKNAPMLFSSQGDEKDKMICSRPSRERYVIVDLFWWYVSNMVPGTAHGSPVDTGCLNDIS